MATPAHDTHVHSAPPSWTHTPGADAKAIYVTLMSRSGHGASAVTYGGVALTHKGNGDSGSNHVCHWVLDDISGRSGNTVSVTGGGSYVRGNSMTAKITGSEKLQSVGDNEGGGHGGNPTEFSIAINPGDGVVAIAYIAGINDWNVNVGSDLAGQTATLNENTSSGGWHARHHSYELITGSHNMGYSHFGSSTAVALTGIAFKAIPGLQEESGTGSMSIAVALVGSGVEGYSGTGSISIGILMVGEGDEVQQPNPQPVVIPAGRVGKIKVSGEARRARVAIRAQRSNAGSLTKAIRGNSAPGARSVGRPRGAPRGRGRSR